MNADRPKNAQQPAPAQPQVAPAPDDAARLARVDHLFRKYAAGAAEQMLPDAVRAYRSGRDT